MLEIHAIPEGRGKSLAHVAQDLHERYEGVFGIETINELVTDSYLKLAETATVTKWLVVRAERFSKERLEALVHAEDHSPKRLPAVLFLCTHNAGRSQMALGWLSHLAKAVLSAGQVARSQRMSST